MAFYHTQSEVRLAVTRFLEVAYNTDGEVTSRLLKSTGPVTVAVDHHGNASISGNAGRLTFSVSEALQDLGMQLRVADVSMHVDDEGMIEFTANFRFVRAASASTRGRIDVEQLITSCSGLLCRAARALKGAGAARDKQLQEALQ